MACNQITALDLVQERAKLMRELVTLGEEERDLVVRNRDVQQKIINNKYRIEEIENDLFDLGEEMIKEGSSGNKSSTS